MPDWIKELLIAFGGGSVVLVGILTIFKNLFIKLFETGIESSFEKSIEKYRNKLSRSTKAYEILLDKEMKYYNSIDSHLAKLVPLVQDIVYCSDLSQNTDMSDRRESIKEYMVSLLNEIPAMKNEVLLFQSYIPQEVFCEVSNLVSYLQDGLVTLNKVVQIIYGESDENIDSDSVKNYSDSVLLHIAVIEAAIKKRLT